MADNSKPARIRQLLSSFVHGGNQNDLSGTGKPSYPQPGTSKKENQNSNVGTSLPRDKKAYFQRISTYSLTWFAKPLWLSPLHCARYGWQNVEKDILHCVSCKAVFTGKLPESHEPDVYEACCERLKEGLKTNHHNVCPWATCPTPENFGAIEIPKRQTALQEYEDRTRHLLTLKKNLPKLDKELEISDHHKQKLSSLIQNCGDLAADELEVLKAAATLALLGWYKKDTASGNAFIHCKYCCREVGLWNFECLSSENHTEKTIVISVNKEKLHSDKTDPQDQETCTLKDENRDTDPLQETKSNGEQNSPMGTKRESTENEDSSEPAKKKMKNSIRHGFNPIQEHKLWCPWINCQMPSKKELEQKNTNQSPATPARPVISSHSIEKFLSLPSWKGLMYTLLPDLSPEKGLFGIVKTTPPHEGIRCIRQVFKGWTSPTAALQGSKSATKL